MPKTLKTDGKGNIVVSPVIGWTTGTLAQMSVLLVIDYADSPEEIKTGGKSVQLGLTLRQTQELAQKLTTLANQLLAPHASDKTQ